MSQKNLNMPWQSYTVCFFWIFFEVRRVSVVGSKDPSIEAEHLWLITDQLQPLQPTQAYNAVPSQHELFK